MDGAAEELEPEAYRALFFHSLDGVLFTDPDSGRILAANPAACRLLGRSEEELRRLGRDGILDPQGRPAWQAALAERSRTGSFHGELGFLRPDGTAFVAEVTSGVFTDAADTVRNCFVTRDVTERKVAEEAIRRSEQRVRRLLETSTEAFIAIDADGRITGWNGQAERTFGWPADEVLGGPFANALARWDGSELRSARRVAAA